VSSGANRFARPGVDPGFPTVGTGAYDLEALSSRFPRHPQAIDPTNGQRVNRNNKPAARFFARRRRQLRG